MGEHFRKFRVTLGTFEECSGRAGARRNAFLHGRHSVGPGDFPDALPLLLPMGAARGVALWARSLTRAFGGPKLQGLAGG